MTWWVSEHAQAGEYVELVSWIFWVLISITLHELAHGWTAVWQGDDTPVRLNRLTANPVTHMGLNSLVMFALCGIAWGQMPVNPHRFRSGRMGDVLVSAAGPAMNLLIACVCALALVLWLRFVPEGGNLYENGALFLYLGVGLNFILAPFNLLPIPPLDGSHILAGFSPRARELFAHPQAALFGMFVFVAVFFMSPVGDILFSAGWLAAAILVDGAGSLLGNPDILPLVFGPG